MQDSVEYIEIGRAPKSVNASERIPTSKIEMHLFIIMCSGGSSGGLWGLKLPSRLQNSKFSESAPMAHLRSNMHLGPQLQNPGSAPVEPIGLTVNCLEKVENCMTVAGTY